ncbi:hypothetical protein [Pseudonocardia acidicola]|uniref:Uncharacterized protein n=1 Tax=Pseudonocardia acidicola TaxID=2724939 RepID=A0ABX1SEH4_9PSEU|nr:hypothetical protein [Pseudonocardia acidicola]NMH99966.1 hypothetical protein [Pseudonocardia acidicola]
MERVGRLVRRRRQPGVTDALGSLSERQVLKVLTRLSSAQVFTILGLVDSVDCFPDRWAI